MNDITLKKYKCARCKLEKEARFFYKRNDTRSRPVSSHCKQCRTIIDRANRLKRDNGPRNNKLLRKSYGLIARSTKYLLIKLI